VSRYTILAVALAIAITVAACAGPGSGTATDAVAPDAAAAEAGFEAPAPDDVAAPGDDGSRIDDHGFRVRVPREHTLPTEATGGQTGWTNAWDRDWMCTLRRGSLDAVVYYQGTPLKDKGWILGGVTYQTTGAWVAAAGSEPVAIEAEYDVGGNHLIDYLRVRVDGVGYRYYHSSLDHKWRTCHAMDCIEVYEDAGEVPTEDGCAPERTLPATCVEVDHDGRVPPLVDTFEPCPDEAG